VVRVFNPPVRGSDPKKIIASRITFGILMHEHYFSEDPRNPPRKGIIKTKIRGLDFEFITSSGIFSYKRIDTGTRILIEAMELPSIGKLLDMGCGYGPIGIVASKVNPILEVWMTDINRRATRLADENVRRNNVKASVVQGIFYESLEDLKFDTIITNPPISAGIKKAVVPIIEGAFNHLKGGGSLQTVIQWNKGGRIMETQLKRVFDNTSIIDRESGYRVFKAIKIH
jgi:16S rRNA (guanine1207-N2)-methyltransferase